MDVCKGPKWKEGMKDLDVEYKDLDWMEVRRKWEYGSKGPK